MCKYQFGSHRILLVFDYQLENNGVPLLGQGRLDQRVKTPLQSYRESCSLNMKEIIIIIVVVNYD